MRYDGNPTKREQLILVDGGRGLLPTPNNEVAPSGGPLGMEVFAYSVPQSEVTIARLVSALAGHNGFESYFDRSGIVEIPDEQGELLWTGLTHRSVTANRMSLYAERI